MFHVCPERRERGDRFHASHAHTCIHTGRYSEGVDGRTYTHTHTHTPAGTPEARTPAQAAAWARLLLSRPALRVSLNERIVTNARAGIYDGCKTAAQLALAT